MSETFLNDQQVARRTVLTGGTLVAGAAVLAGCGSSDTTSTGTASAAPSSASATAATSPAENAALAQLADVPVGGAVAAMMGGKPVIVAQPASGTAVAFSAICTHKGCTVAPAGAKLECPCHGSVFDALTGKVLQGPAGAPLASVAVSVKDGAVVAG